MKHYVLAASVAVMSCAAFAQTAVTTERTETRVESTNGGVTTVETTVVVREYVTYLYDVYIAVGVPRPQIVQLIDLDLQILDARVRGNFDQVRTLVRRQVDLVSVPVVQRIHTHVVSHRPPASIPVYAQPVWVNNVNVVNNEVNIEINETEIKNSVQQSNVKAESLNINAAKQAVESGKIEQLKAGSAADNKTNTDAKTGADAKIGTDAKADTDAAKTPGANETPSSTDRDAAKTPAANATPSTDADATPATSGAQTNPTCPENRAGSTPGTNSNPGATPANAADRDRENTNSPNATAPATPATGAAATPGASSSTPSSSATPASSAQTPASSRATPLSSTQRSNPNQATNNAVEKTRPENVRDSSNPSSTPTPLTTN